MLCIPGVGTRYYKEMQDLCYLIKACKSVRESVGIMAHCQRVVRLLNLPFESQLLSIKVHGPLYSSSVPAVVGSKNLLMQQPRITRWPCRFGRGVLSKGSSSGAEPNTGWVGRWQLGGHLQGVTSFVTSRIFVKPLITSLSYIVQRKQV